MNVASIALLPRILAFFRAILNEICCPNEFPELFYFWSGHVRLWVKVILEQTVWLAIHGFAQSSFHAFLWSIKPFGFAGDSLAIGRSGLRY